MLDYRILIALGLFASTLALAAPTLEEQLTQGQYLHSLSYVGATGTPTWDRNSTEFEGVIGLTCKDPGIDQTDLSKKLLKVLTANNWAEFRKMVSCSSCEAFTTGYPIDEMPWDQERHDIREANPNLWMTIEPDRFAADPTTGARKLSLGSDLMDDIYFDTPSLTGFKNNITIRARKRWDSWQPTDAPSMRRILVGLKKNYPISGSNGFKNDDKLDIRLDSPSLEQIEGFNAELPTGFNAWNGPKTPIVPVQKLYSELVATNTLPDVGPYKQVMQLEPQVFLRSLRRRYHLNETEFSRIQGFYDNAVAKITETAGLAQKMINETPGLPQDVSAQLSALVVQGNLIALGASTVKEGLKAYEAQTWVDDPAGGTGSYVANPMQESDLQAKKAAAEAASANLHSYAKMLSDATAVLAGAASDGADADRFRAFQIGKDKSLAILTTYDQFYQLYRGIVDTAGVLDPTVIEYNTFAQAQLAAANPLFAGFTTVDALGFRAIGPQILREELKIWARQIEAGGSSAIGMWFDIARGFYVPKSRRQTENFIIDSFDATAMFLAKDLETSVYSKDAAGVVTQTTQVLPVNKLNNTTELTTNAIDQGLILTSLVGEGQIELGLEKPFTDRLKELQAANQDTQGVEFVFNEYHNLLPRIGVLKKKQVFKALKRNSFNGLCNQWVWSGSEAAKGEKALAIVKQLGGL